MHKAFIYVTLVAVLLAFIAGALLFGKATNLLPESREKQRIENAELAERLEAERPVHFWTTVLLRAILLISLAGVIIVALIWGARRASEIRPGPDGQFPVVRINKRGVTVLHDPNRQLAPTVIYTKPELAEQVAVIPVVAPEMRAEQVATTARAQAVQLASAIHKHPPAKQSKGKDNTAAALAGAMRMPQIEIVSDPVEIERFGRMLTDGRKEP